MLGVAVSSVSKWIDEGKLTAGRTPGGHRRIEADDLLHFLRQQKLRIPGELDAPPQRILIVDDDESLRKWLSAEIKDRYPDVEVTQAHDGYSAGEIVGTVRPDIIVLDLYMPGIDGFEVCRRIKENPLTGQRAVIAMSGQATPEARSRILRMGASAFLEKPLDVASFFDEVKNILGR
jgi:excisionase family DNA binding protein